MKKQLYIKTTDDDVANQLLDFDFALLTKQQIGDGLSLWTFTGEDISSSNYSLSKIKGDYELSDNLIMYF